jgi:hypothetical protein
MDDWLVVLRAIRNGEAPGVTIDPGPNPSLMQVRYFGGIERTTLGQNFFEADRTLKLLSTGFDNNNCQAWEPRPPGIPTEMDLLARDIWNSDSDARREGWHRFWFEPTAEPLETEETASGFTIRIPVNRLIVNDESIPPGHPSRSSSEFAQAVTKNFLDTTAKVRSFRRLQSAAALIETAKWIQDKRIPIDESWLGGSISQSATAETTPSITVLRAALKDQIYLRYGIHGGVDFQKDNAYRSALFASNPIASAARKSQPRTGSRWDFVVADHKYRAVRMKVAKPAALATVRTRWVRLAGGLPQPSFFRLVFPDSTLEITNRGLSPLSVKLNGPVSKAMLVSHASEMITVLPGSYEISVSSGACLPRTDNFTVDEGQSYRLQFECREAPPPPRVPEGFYIVENQTGGTLEVEINGPSSQTRQLPPGTSTISLATGSYTIRATASCGQKSETFTLSEGSRFTGTYRCVTVGRQ